MHSEALSARNSPVAQTSARKETMSISPTGVVLALVLLGVAGWSLAFFPPLHPTQLWAIPWCFAVTLYSLRLLPYRSLSWETVTIAAAATLAFALCALVGERVATRIGVLTYPRPALRPNYTTVRIAALAVVCITIVWAAAFAGSASATYGARDTLTASARLRNELGSGALSLQIKYVYAALASVALCSIAAGLALERGPRLMWLSSAIACGASIYLATGRSTIISALIIGLVAYLISRGRPIRVRRFLAGAGVVGAVALAIFIAGGQLIGKTYSNNAELQAVASVFTSHSSVSSLALPYMYASAPVAALEVQMRSATTWGDAGGCAEVVELCKALRKLNVQVQPVPRIRPFTATPLPWNTYTALDSPLIDGGKMLVVPIVALLGLLCGLLWAWSRSGRPMGILAYSVAAAAIAGSPAVFLFTAPHILGALLIGALAIWLANKLPENLANRLSTNRGRDGAGAVPD
jgi:oligosaccharide repeat unit polymerase